jgi:hypothetical protein
MKMTTVMTTTTTMTMTMDGSSMRAHPELPDNSIAHLRVIHT